MRGAKVLRANLMATGSDILLDLRLDDEGTVYGNA